MVTYDGQEVRTYRDGKLGPNQVSLYDHCLTDEEVRNRFQEISNQPHAIKQSKEQILNRFIQ